MTNDELRQIVRDAWQAGADFIWVDEGHYWKDDLPLPCEEYVEKVLSEIGVS